MSSKRARLHVVTGKGGTGKDNGGGRAGPLALATGRPAHPAGGDRRPTGHRPVVRHQPAALLGSSASPSPRAAAEVGARLAVDAEGRAAGLPGDVSTTWASLGGRCAGWGGDRVSPPPWPLACATCCSPARSKEVRDGVPVRMAGHVYDAGRAGRAADRAGGHLPGRHQGPWRICPSPARSTGRARGVVRLLHSADTVGAPGHHAGGPAR